MTKVESYQVTFEYTVYLKSLLFNNIYSAVVGTGSISEQVDSELPTHAHRTAADNNTILVYPAGRPPPRGLGRRPANGKRPPINRPNHSYCYTNNHVCHVTFAQFVLFELLVII